MPDIAISFILHIAHISSKRLLSLHYIRSYAICRPLSLALLNVICRTDHPIGNKKECIFIKTKVFPSLCILIIGFIRLEDTAIFINFINYDFICLFKLFTFITSSSIFTSLISIDIISCFFARIPECITYITTFTIPEISLELICCSPLTSFIVKYSLCFTSESCLNSS